MTDRDDVVVVGGGLAAAKAVEAAREAGFEGRVVVFSDEEVRPYERPPLSKGLLLGETATEEVFVHGEDFYGEHDIQLRLGERVVELDRAAGEVVTASGARSTFDRLLIATGAEPRRLPVEGVALEGVHLLRDLEDSRRLRAALTAAVHVTVVGAGWIGCEVAAAARTLGAEVTMVDPLTVPLQRVLGAEVGGLFADLHRDHGVDLRLGRTVEALRGTRTVEAAVLDDGSRVETEVVVVGIGVIPRAGLAERAGLEVDDGIVTDATLTTADLRILAAGDVARARHPLLDRHLRVEHWANALHQGSLAGRNLAGGEEAYDRLPYFFTDQYELGMEYAGHASDWDRVVLRGDPDAGEFAAFWVDADGRVLAGMHANLWGTIDDIKALVRRGRPVDLGALGDPGIPLSDVPVEPTTSS